MGLDHALIKLKKDSKEQETICNWRKENHFHKWFIDRYPEGDNGEAEVSFEDMMDFKETCDDVIETLVKAEPKMKSVLTHQTCEKGKWINHYEDMPVYDDDLVEDLLPPQEGFFFGGTTIARWYLESVIDAKHKVDETLKKHQKGDKYYYWSWW